MTMTIETGSYVIRVRNPTNPALARASVQRRVFNPQRRAMNALRAPHVGIELSKASAWEPVEGA